MGRILFSTKMSLNPNILWFSRLMIFGFGAVLPLTLIFALFTFTDHEIIFPSISLILIAALLFFSFMSVIFFAPTELKLSAKKLFIVRRIRNLEISLKKISSIQSIHDFKNQIGFTIRIFGVNNIYGSFGKYWSKEIGDFTRYSTSKDLLSVTMIDNEKVLLSSDKNEELVQNIKRQNRNIQLLN